MMLAYVNPYYKQNFFGFFLTMASRLWALMSGQIGYRDLVADEIQMLVLAGVASSAALVGAFLILRRMTMLANSLSHTILLGIVIGYLVMHPELITGEALDHHAEPLNLTALLLAALLMGIVTTLLTEILTRSVRLQEDASTGLVFTSLFALGVILISLFTRNAHVGTEVVMGNVDALHLDDIRLVFVVLLANLALISLFYKEYQLTTFDPGLARVLGFSNAFFNYLLMTQVAATVIGAFRAVGVLMVLAFITAPPLTARLLTSDLKRMLWLSALIGIVCSICGVALSRHCLSVLGLPLSTAGIVVCLLVVAFLLALFFAPERGFLSKFLRRKSWRRKIVD